MDDRTFYDMMLSHADPYHVASTVGGAMVQEGRRGQSYPTTWLPAPRQEEEFIPDPHPYAEPFDPTPPGTAGAGAHHRGGGSADHDPGIVVGLAIWFIRVLWPLNAMERLGRRITRVTWKGKLPLATLAAVTAPAAIGSGGAMVLILGAAAGWFFLPIVGTLIALVAVLTGLALALGAIGIGLVVGYNILRAFLT